MAGVALNVLLSQLMMQDAGTWGWLMERPIGELAFTLTSALDLFGIVLVAVSFGVRSITASDAARRAADSQDELADEQP